ncbi:tethering complex subunit [Balamuthia mandrillaris]
MDMLLYQFERGEDPHHSHGLGGGDHLPYDNIDEFLEGYVDASAIAPREDPIFSLQKIEYNPKDLKSMVVCNDTVILALRNNHLIRLRLDAPSELEEIEFVNNKKVGKDQIHKVFMDPTGNHVVISMVHRDNYYIHSSWPKPRNLSKMRGITIESIAWNTQNGSNAVTSEILIGSNDGRIFETVIEAKDKLFVEGKERYFKPVYNMNEDMPVTGLRYEKFPPTPSEPIKYFVMATTPTRIYQFIGGPTFEAVFSNYEHNPGFEELPGELNQSQLCFFSKYQGLPKRFAWLTGPGIYHGNLVFGSQNPGDSVTIDTRLLPYPARTVDDRSAVPSGVSPIASPPSFEAMRAAGSPQIPLALILTEFHFLLLYEDKFQAISVLNDEIVHEEHLGRGAEGSRMQGMTVDPTVGSMWVYAEDSVYQLIVEKEDRHVWELYLEKGQFEAAINYCQTPEQKDKVLCAQADYYFGKRSYELAAKYYSKTQKSFEEVALKFINMNERDALKTFLLGKLSNLSEKDATQKTLVCTWLTEIYINKLNHLRDSRLEDQHEMLLDEFKQFLDENHKDNLDKTTTYDLLASHGRMNELLYYAMLIQDYGRVIRHHVQNGAYERALQVMSKQTSPDLYYTYSPVLMQHIPYHTVNAWISARTPLNPRKLIPALMRYDKSKNPEGERQDQAIRYLEHCVNKLQNDDPAVHNYLISLYAQQDDDHDLLAFLNNNEESHYDLEYALRLCTKHNKQRACVLIYSAMNLYEEAVDLAMKVDIDLAKINADKPADDDELRKKLWLRIARYVVEEEKDIKKAMELLTQCDLLKIEDILPFFPDFVLIDDFKSEICESLEDYNQHIEELKAEMDDATRSANLIRLDIKQLRSKYGFVAGNRTCDLCSYPVLSRQFYLFPCQHVFHEDCLKREVRIKQGSLLHFCFVLSSRLTQITDAARPQR